MLEPEIVTISDDSDHSDFFPGRAVGGNSVRLPFKRLADDSSDQDPDDVAVGSLLGKRFARVKTAGPNCAPRRESVSAQHGSSAEADVADDEMATATMSMGITPSVEGRGFALPDAALHLDKTNLFTERNSLRDRLKQIEAKLVSVRDKIEENVMGKTQPFVIKSEQESSDSSDG